jgi:hypothetical protein
MPVVANTDPIAPCESGDPLFGNLFGRKLNPDAKPEAFVNDDAANAMRSRKARSADYDFREIMKKAGV